MRLIDADELIHFYFDDEDGNKTFGFVPDDIIDKALTIEAEPIKHGRWICINGWVHCSVCHQEPPNESNIESDYCPNCGADMRAGREDGTDW